MCQAMSLAGQVCGGGGDLEWNSFGGVWGWEGKVLRVTEVLGAVGYHPHAFSAGKGTSRKQGCLASSLHQIFSVQCKAEIQVYRQPEPPPRNCAGPKEVLGMNAFSFFLLVFHK